MLLVAPVRLERRTCDPGDEPSGLEKLRMRRSEVPAVTHVDFSARVQTVDEPRHGRYHELLRAFERKTECGLVINTSFNVRGEPIVCTPEDAYRCFMATGMDALVMERFVLLKKEQEGIEAVDVGKHLARFAPD
jgi:carbamoyltransferase